MIGDTHAAHVLERGEGTWTRVSTIVPPDPEEAVHRVAIDGRTVALAAGLSASAQPWQIHMYEQTGDAWRRTATIPLPGRDPFEFVSEMHLSKEQLAVLVLGGTHGGVHRAAIEIFERRSDEWLPTSSLQIPHWPIEIPRLDFALAADDLVVGSSWDRPSSARRTAGRSRSSTSTESSSCRPYPAPTIRRPCGPVTSGRSSRLHDTG